MIYITQLARFFSASVLTTELPQPARAKVLSAIFFSFYLLVCTSSYKLCNVDHEAVAVAGDTLLTASA